jgi:hypothetical protein
MFFRAVQFTARRLVLWDQRQHFSLSQNVRVSFCVCENCTLNILCNGSTDFTHLINNLEDYEIRKIP